MNIKLAILCCLISSIVFVNGNAQLLINEIMATNASQHLETDFYNFSDWIEIYNSSNNSVGLNNYYLSDEKTNLKKWKMPTANILSKGYYYIYCDKENSGRHSNFGLSTDGETIYLSNATGSIIDSVQYSMQYPNVSYGRNPQSNNLWNYCAQPTMGKSNAVSTAIKPSPKAKFSLPGGVITQTTELQLLGDEIRYTTNGSEPTESSNTYSSPISINKTTIVKAKTYQEGFLPGGPKANTYFYNEHGFTIPVISISFNNEYFYDNMIGIHVSGSNGAAGFCGGDDNWYQDWERPVYFEYFDKEGKQQISQSAGIKVSGGCTRGRDQKSLSLYARSKYGNNDFDYAFFKQKPWITSFKSLLLRNSGNDQDQTLLRDAFVQALVSNSVDIDYQSYQPTAVYFNGVYRGVMNLREKTDEDYFLSNYSIKSDEIDFLERDMEIVRGSNTEYAAIISFIESNDMTNETNYNWVAEQLDINEYINYWAIETILGNADWPENNIKFWKKKKNGKWRWILFDTDYGLGFRMDAPNFRSFHDILEDENNEPWANVLFKKLMENESFRNQYFKTFLTIMQTCFNPDWCDLVLDSLATTIDTEIAYNQKKYGRTKNNWVNFIETLRSQAHGRYQFMGPYFKSYFGLENDFATVSINNTAPNKGKVALNQSVIQHYPVNVELVSQLALSINAVPEKGYHFKHWEYASSVKTDNLISINDVWYFNDSLNDYPENWTLDSFDHSGWPNGNAQLGYGDGDENTEITYGDDENNKIPTALFRKQFELPDTSGIIKVTLGIVADDGAIIYLNGKELIRFNMPESIVTFSSYADGTVENENVIEYYVIDKNLLQKGNNTIACEVHQASSTSSDMSFDLSLEYSFKQKAQGSGIYSMDAILESDSTFDLSLAPIFEAIEPVKDIYINEIATDYNGFTDDKGEKSGFIEIINHGSSNALLNGFFITDKKSDMERYAIPENTELATGSFSVFYADKQLPQGEKHMPFKLNRQGETIYLIQKVGEAYTILDSVQYDFLVEGYSYGKYEDATGPLQHMVNPTPNSANDPEKPVIGIQKAMFTDQVNLFPNPASSYLNVNFKNEVTANCMLEIIDLSGCVVSPKYWLNANSNHILLHNISNGVYILRLINEKNVIAVHKLVIAK